MTKKIHESHITTSSSQKDVFRYLIDDVDDSSSENNIHVLGIVDFSESPHQINKKAYYLKNSCSIKAHPISTNHASVLTYINFRSVTTLWLLNGFHQK